MLLVTICKKPHTKIPYRYRTVIRHLRASHRWNFTNLDASRQFESCLSFLEECMSQNLELYTISTHLPGNNMQKTPFKNSSWLSYNLKMFEYMSSRKNLQIDMTWGHWPCSRVIIKNLDINVAFLLGKSVLLNLNIPILPEAFLTFASKSCWPLLWNQAAI